MHSDRGFGHESALRRAPDNCLPQGVAAKEMWQTHTHLLEEYAGGGADSLADIPDDGYIMQNVGHHLVHIQRLQDLRQLLLRPAWLECKLHSYGVASVVADFR